MMKNNSRRDLQMNNAVKGFNDIKIRKTVFQSNNRVVLPEALEDPHSPLPKGLMGSVISVDDIGTVHVLWDGGIRLGITTEDKISLSNAENVF
jgi:hypothetical protein